MTIVLPQNYHAWDALVERQILCVSQDQALREDIRALRIGVLNIMPKADQYEFSLIFPLGRSIIQIEPIWIRLETHTYSSTDKRHLKKLYVTFEQAIQKGALDGLIVTGAPVEDIPFEEVRYFDEVVQILAYAQRNIPSTLGICWGGLAIAKFLSIEKVSYSKKLFGIYELANLNRSNQIFGEMDDRFWCPQSRFSGIEDSLLETEQQQGKLNLLAHSEKTGYVIFETVDHRFVVHLGHPEYEPDRLVEEFERDQAEGRDKVSAPENLDLADPVNRWRGHRSEFFTQWIKYIHDSTSK